MRSTELLNILHNRFKYKKVLRYTLKNTVELKSSCFYDDKNSKCLDPEAAGLGVVIMYHNLVTLKLLVIEVIIFRRK